MTSELPKFTIVTPSYNQGRFLEKTIVSVLNQGYPNLEYFVIDGGSTDESVRVIERYAGHIDYWTSERDRGQSAAINKGFARATGDLLGWLNSDDQLEAGVLRIVAEHAARFADAGAFVGHGRLVNTTGSSVIYKAPPEVTFAALCRWCYWGGFMQPSCFFRRAAWLAAGPLDEDVHIALDVDLWLRMVASKVRFEAIDAVLSTSLAHPAAKTAAREEMVIDTAIVVIRAGGEKFIRPHLVEMARAARAHEAGRLWNHPLVKPALQVGRGIWRRTIGRLRPDQQPGRSAEGAPSRAGDGANPG